MKDKNECNIEERFSLWGSIEKVILFGAGAICRRSIKKILAMVEVKCIVDNNAFDGESIEGIDVVKPDVIYQIGKQNLCKTVITTHYNEISCQLVRFGLKENIDFIALDKFIGIWSLQKKNEICLLETHLAITTECTLKCQHCNMYIPYYKNTANINLDILKNDIEKFFKFVNRVFVFTLIGGEPFLSKHVSDLICHLHNCYKEQYGEIEIVTNGTIIPNEDILNVLSRYNVMVTISDYSKQIPYNNRVNQLVDILKDHNIRHQRKMALEWKDFAFPNKKVFIQDSIKHMKLCSPIFKGINDGKFYYCHLVWSAVKAGLWKEESSDFIDLDMLDETSYDKRKFLLYALGENTDISLCKVCMGCGIDNEDFIKAAVQIQTTDGLL